MPHFVSGQQILPDGITLIPAYIPTHLNFEANYLLQGSLVTEMHLLPDVAQAAFQLSGHLEVDLLASSHTNQCQQYYILENPLPVGALGLNTFSHPWTYEVSYVLSPAALVTLVFIQVSTKTCHRSINTSDSSCTLLVEASWLPTVLMLEDIPHWCPIVKILVRYVLVGKVLRDMLSLHLMAQRFVLYRKGFSS